MNCSFCCKATVSEDLSMFQRMKKEKSSRELKREKEKEERRAQVCASDLLCNIDCTHCNTDRAAGEGKR